MKMFLYAQSRHIVRTSLTFLCQWRIQGIEHVQNLKPPFLIVSNHIWRLDPMVIMAAMPYPQCYPIHFVTYHRYMEQPIQGSILRFYGAVPIRKGIGVEQSLD